MNNKNIGNVKGLFFVTTLILTAQSATQAENSDLSFESENTKIVKLKLLV